MNFPMRIAEGDRAFKSGRAEEARAAWTAAAHEVSRVSEAADVAGRFLSLGFLTEADAVLSSWKVTTASLLALRASLALESGKVEESLRLLDEANPASHLTFMSNSLLVSHYLTPEKPEAIKEKSIFWAQRAKAARPDLSSLPILQKADGYLNKPIRIGFVSGDLCAHPVGFLLTPIFQALALHSNELEVFVFDNGEQNDWVTERLKSSCSTNHWNKIRSLNAYDASRILIQSDLDVLIDCSGHTSRSRLALFANRLAPLQISWGGYFSTTGLDTIDAVIMDHHHSPEVSNELFVEPLIRFPSRFIYAPLPNHPPVSDTPYFRNGVITFGSFNNIAKINKNVVSVWSSILRAVPRSRLILKWRCFSDQRFSDNFKNRFLSYGIDSERIELRPFSIYRDVLSEYRDIDIALDTFPFTGGQTSLDALWMGVPLVTLAGLAPVARQGHALVNLIQRPEWSSSNADDYANCAICLAQDPNLLRSMRFEQRGLIDKSKLCDASSFVDHLINFVKRIKYLRK